MDLMKKIESGRQYRNMSLGIVNDENEESEQGSFLVRGYATTYNEPYVLFGDDEYEIREQVSPEAFNNADLSDVIMQYDHQGRVFARISNNTLSLQSDEHGLLIEANLGGTEIGRQLYEEIKGGYTSKMSFGFIVADDAIEEFTEGSKRVYLRTITNVSKVFDVSAVSLPANDGTEISARAYCDGVIAKAEAERLLKAEEERKAQAMELLTRVKKLSLEVRCNGN